MDGMDESSIERANRSTIWEYFEVKNSKERTAECKACRDVFSFRSSISNLRKHFMRKHGHLVSHKFDSDIKKSSSDVEEDTQVEHLEETYLEESSEENQQNDTNNKRKHNKAWDYFDITDESAFKATCRLCAEEYSYRSTTGNLCQHLRKTHLVHLKDSDDEWADNSNGASARFTVITKKSKSAAWKYFTVQDESARIARCNICGALNSFMTSISNLVKHVKRKHTDVIDYDSNQLNDSSDEKSGSEEETQSPACIDTAVWRYFKKLDNAAGLAECLLCKKILCFMSSLRILTKHLSKKHPHVKLRNSSKEKTMFMANDGQWYEMVEDGGKNDNDDNDPISGTITEPMEIYLDEQSGNVIEDKRRTKLKKAVKKRKRPAATITVKNDSSSDEPFPRRRYKEDSLDAFSKYLGSLLRELPHEASIQLQGELIRQVIEKKMSLKNDNQSVVVTMQQEEEAVTVPNATDDHIYVVTNIEEQK